MFLERLALVLAWLAVGSFSTAASCQTMSARELELELRSRDAELFRSCTTAAELVTPCDTEQPESGQVTWRTEWSTNGKTWCALASEPTFSITRPLAGAVRASGSFESNMDGSTTFFRPLRRALIYSESHLRYELQKGADVYDRVGVPLRRLPAVPVVCEWPRRSLREAMTGPQWWELLMATGRGFSLHLDRITSVSWDDKAPGMATAIVEGPEGGRFEFVVETTAGFLVRQCSEIVGGHRYVRVATSGLRFEGANGVAASATIYSRSDPATVMATVRISSCKYAADAAFIEAMTQELDGEIKKPTEFLDFRPSPSRR